MTAQYWLIIADLVAISVLTFAVYFPRHRRRDLVLAYVGINVGVLAVSTSLASSTVGAGLGLGLFGVLSIIRLRSSELDQHEVAHYFSALALGLLGGLSSGATLLPVALMALIVAAVYLAGHPRLLPGYRHQLMVLDTAYTDEAALIAHTERLLGARVHRVSVHKVDLVNDTTVVDVRYRVSASRAGAEVTAAAGREPVGAGR